jgi:hypothetical protein
MYLEKIRLESMEPSCIRQPFQPRQVLPICAIELLRQSSVQEELQLAASQKQTIQDLTRQRRSLSHQIKQGHLDVCQSEFENIASLEHHMMMSLSPAQTERLGQLLLQKRGPLAFQDGDVCNRLEFREDQYFMLSNLVEKLEEKQAQARERGIDALREIDALTSDISRQLFGMLTAEQKTRWNAMQGVPFDFDLGRPVPLAAEASE